jgi:uncharacterized protein (TIGR00725 family)
VNTQPPRVAVFGSSALAPDDPAWAEVELLGFTLAGSGCIVVNGGYGGVMEAASAGAARAGGRVVGVTVPAVFPDRSSPNAHLSEEIPAPTIPFRIATLLDGTDAAIVLPGSIGTLAELVVSWNVRFAARHGASPDLALVVVGSDWGELVPMLAHRLSIPLELVELAATVGEAGALVLHRLGLVNPGSPAGDYPPAARMEPLTQ